MVQLALPISPGRHPLIMLMRYGRSAKALAKEAAFVMGRPVRARRRRSAKRTMVLHGGFRKTGSSFIQGILKDNASLLADHVTVAARRAPISTDALAQTSDEYTKRLESRRRLHFEMAVEALAAQLRTQPHRTVLLSEENLLATSVTSAVGDIFHMAVEALEIFQRMLPDFDIHLIVYTREREPWLDSCYNQAVRWHRETAERKRWMATNSACRDWDAGIAHMRERLDMPITAISMEQERSEARFLGEGVLKAAGVPDETLGKLALPTRRNESVGPAQLAFMRLVNGLSLPWRDTHGVAMLVRGHPELFHS